VEGAGRPESDWCSIRGRDREHETVWRCVMTYNGVLQFVAGVLEIFEEIINVVLNL
jgi:hypothetical protein